MKGAYGRPGAPLKKPSYIHVCSTRGKLAGKVFASKILLTMAIRMRCAFNRHHSYLVPLYETTGFLKALAALD